MAQAPAWTIPVDERLLDYYDMRISVFFRHLDLYHTVEVRAHTQPVGGGARQFRSRGQVSVGQSLIFQARYNLTGRVAPNSSAANGAGIRVILSHRGQQQRDIVAFRSYHRVFRRLIGRLGPAPR